MTSGSSGLRSRRHHGPRANHFHARSNALLIGPGGEVVAAYGSGTKIPGVPMIATGRVVQNPTDLGPVAPTPVTATGDGKGFISQTGVSPPSAVSLQEASTAAPESLTLEAVTSMSPSHTLPSSPSTVVSVPTTTSQISGTSQASSVTSSFSSSASTPASSSVSTLSSSAASTISSSSPASVPASSPASPTSRHGSSLYFGVAFAAIAAVAFLVALVTYFIRIRSQSRRHDRSAKMRWPWDRNPDDMEGGLAPGSTYDYGRFGATAEKSDIFRPLPYPSAVLGADDAFHGFYNPAILNSPYRTVHVAEAQLSVPDLAPDLGALQVTNYAPGDVSSDEDASRANSRQGNLPRPPSSLTPTIGDHWVEYRSEDGFKNPWSPLRTGSAKGLAISDGKERTTPGIVQPDATLSNSRISQTGWAASIRSNIVNAFQSVVGGPTQPPEDHFTALPERRPSRKECSQEAEDTEVGEVPEDADTLTSWIRNAIRTPAEANDIRLPSPALLHLSTRLGPSPLKRAASSIYTSNSAVHSPIPSADKPADPFADTSALDALPELPLTRAASSSSAAKHSTPAKHTPRTRKSHKAARKPTTLHRKYTSSFCSVGSDMSRSSSRASVLSPLSRENSLVHRESVLGRKQSVLTDQERFASSMLRQRRKRVAEAQRLAAKQSVRRPGVRLGSRRAQGGKGADVEML